MMHHTTIQFYPGHPGFRPVCICGYRGGIDPSEPQAELEARNHRGENPPTVRELAEFDRLTVKEGFTPREACVIMNAMAEGFAESDNGVAGSS